jgi:hypothetical protein
VLRRHRFIAGQLRGLGHGRHNLLIAQPHQGPRHGLTLDFDTNWCQNADHVSGGDLAVDVGLAEIPDLPAIILEGLILVAVQTLIPDLFESLTHFPVGVLAHFDDRLQFQQLLLFCLS